MKKNKKSIKYGSQGKHEIVEAQNIVSGESHKIEELQELEHLAEVESGDIVNRVELYEKVNREKNQRGSTFYRDLLHALIGVRMNEKDAEKDWRDILIHKTDMGKKLGRNVGIKVATLDFYTNIKRSMKSPKIIEIDEYTQTVREAISDQLTHAYNRRYFDFFLGNLFRKAKREDIQFSMLMVDIDHFKIYNDKNGHIKGDLALIEITRIMNALSQKNHAVARYGGEEFAIIMPDADEFEAYIMASNIRKAVYDFRFPGEYRVPLKRLSVSIGISTFNGARHRRPKDIIEEADKSLYKAKEEGRNRVVSFKEIDAGRDGN
jgi:diguanylate cyclase (GGDEF)-like protein